MKKLIALCLCAVMCFGMSGCGSQQGSSSTPESSALLSIAPVATETPKPTVKPTASPSPKTEMKQYSLQGIDYSVFGDWPTIEKEGTVYYYKNPLEPTEGMVCIMAQYIEGAYISDEVMLSSFFGGVKESDKAHDFQPAQYTDFLGLPALLSDHKTDTEEATLNTSILVFGYNEYLYYFSYNSIKEKSAFASEFQDIIDTISLTEPLQTPAPVPSIEPTSTPVPTTEVTMGQKNALKKAKEYLSIMAFSHSGLVAQLEYEKFTHDDAVYAADNCGADWNEQAAKKAKDYLDMMSFSRDGLIEQLEYEGFTNEQAVYGAEQNGY